MSWEGRHLPCSTIGGHINIYLLRIELLPLRFSKFSIFPNNYVKPNFGKIVDLKGSMTTSAHLNSPEMISLCSASYRLSEMFFFPLFISFVSFGGYIVSCLSLDTSITSAPWSFNIIPAMVTLLYILKEDAARPSNSSTLIPSNGSFILPRKIITFLVKRNKIIKTKFLKKPKKNEDGYPGSSLTRTAF